MEIWSSISILKYFISTYPMTIVIVSVTTQSTISFWMIHCIDVVSIPSFNDVLHMKRLNMFWMIATSEHVAVIYLGWLQPKKSFTLAIPSLQSLKIVTRLWRNSHPVNIFIRKSTLILLRYTPSLSLALFPMGDWLYALYAYLSWGAWLHHHIRWLFHKMG